MRYLLTSALCFAIAFSCGAAGPGGDASPRQLQEMYAKVAEKALPAVVTVLSLIHI